MRKQFTQTISQIIKKDKKTTLLLGDIGVFSFRDLFRKYPKRIYNIGILEQSMISLAAGLSNEGLKPIVHTIAPFIVSRALEQLKIDFGYNKLNGNFISIGSSYDYASLGCTHHCPEDVNLMYNIPGMQIVVPGSGQEFQKLFNQSYSNNKPTYFRLSDFENEKNMNVSFGKANFLNNNSKITILAVGPVLNFLYPVIEEFGVNLIYVTTVRPFDPKIFKNIKKNCKSLIIVEPFYGGAILNEIVNSINIKNIYVQSLSVPFKFLTNYGTKKDHDFNLGFSTKNIRNIIKKILKDD
jgi:transketolase